MNISEFTDRDGDALTITTNPEGIWITCTSDRDEVTVGPFQSGILRVPLTDVSLPRADPSSTAWSEAS